MNFIALYAASITIILNLSCSNIRGLLGLTQGKSLAAAAGKKDASGNEIFSKLISTFPEDGAENIFEDTSISLLFSEPIDSSQIVVNHTDNQCSGFIQLSNDNFSTCVKFKELIANPNELKSISLEPDEKLSFGSRYYLRLKGQVNQDMAISSNDYWVMTQGFKVRSLPDLNPPTVVSIFPSDGADEVAVDAKVILEFSEPIDASTIALASKIGECASSSIEISADEFTSCLPLSKGYLLSPDRKRLTIRPTIGFTYGVTYKVKVKTSLNDLAGNGLSKDWVMGLGFKILTPPEVIAILPADGELEVSRDASITIEFSEAIDATSIVLASNLEQCSGSSIELSKDNFSTCMPLSQTFNLSEDKRRLQISAASDFVYGAIYKVKVNTSLQDLAGNGLASSWTMSSGFSVLNPPQVVDISPAEGEIEVPIDSSINLEFSEAIHASSIILATSQDDCGSSSIVLTSDDFSSCILLSQNFSLSEDQKRLTITPKASLEYGRRFKIKVTTSLQDLAGNGLLSDWVSSAGFMTDSWRANLSLGSNLTDQAKAIAIDASGHIVLAGKTSGALEDNSAAGGNDIFVARYSPSGEKLWITQYGTAFDDEARGVSVDGDGNIYVTGFTLGSLDSAGHSGDYDIFLSKFSKNGDKQFTRSIGTTYKDEAFSVSICGGYIYITGTSYGSFGGVSGHDSYSVFLSKYDLSGNQEWIIDEDSNKTEYKDYSYAVACSHTSDVYLTGTTNGTLGELNMGGYDIFVSKFSSAGTKAWTRQLGTTGNDEGKAITIDAQGDIYVTGFTSGELVPAGHHGGADLFLAKLNSYGDILWMHQLGTSADDTGHSLSIDATGAIYISGFSSGDLDATNAGLSDVIIAKFDSNEGDLVWLQQIGSPTEDVAFGIANFEGGVFITGSAGPGFDGLSHQGGDLDAFLIKYSAEGIKQ